MTAKREGAWAQCQCGRRMRASNKNGICGRCRQKLMNTLYCTRSRRARAERAKKSALAGHPLPDLSDIDVATMLAHEALLRARVRGHVLDMEPDATPAAYVGKCEKCGGFVAVDATETPNTYGRAYEQPCPGTPSVAPAVRRNPMLDPTVYTSASSERADNGDPWVRGTSWAEEEFERWA